MARHFTENEKIEIRKRLLKSAKKLFVRYGFSKTNIQDITKEASIGKGSFYTFYNSKGDIFLEVYQTEREKIRKEIYFTHKEAQGEFSEKLYKLLHYLIDILNSNEILRLMYEPGTLDAIMDKAVEKRLKEYNKKTNQTLLSVIDHWLGRKTEDKETEIIVGMLRAITLLRHHTSAIGPDIYDEVIESMIDCIIEGITKRYNMTTDKQ